jgi:hypothetical protein
MNEVAQGFMGLKRMVKNLLEEGKEKGELRTDINTDRATEMIFSGMIGASVLFGVEKSDDSLNKSINSLILYLDGLSPAGTIADLSVEDKLLEI